MDPNAKLGVHITLLQGLRVAGKGRSVNSDLRGGHTRAV